MRTPSTLLALAALSTACATAVDPASDDAGGLGSTGDASLGDGGYGTSDAGSDALMSADVDPCGDGAVSCSGQCVQTVSDPSHCGACSVACSGGDASCSASACAATLRVRGYIDDRAQFVIKGAAAHWYESVGAAPGLWQGANQPTYIDDVPWTPVWPASGENRACNCSSSDGSVTMLAAKAQTITMTVVQGRGSATIVQQPSVANAFTAVIEFSDPPGGADWYEALLGYATN